MDASYTAEYEQFELRHWWFVVRRRIIHAQLDRFVASPDDVRWLDIGCGTGVLLDSYRPIQRKLGIEMDAGSVQRARDRGLDVRQTSPSAWNLSGLGRFQLVSLCDVLEHLPDERPAIDAVEEVIDPQGLLLVTVPALQSLWSPHDEVNRHYRRYRRPQLRGLLDPSRWEVLRCTYFCSLLLPAIWTVRQIRRARRSGEASHDFRFGPPILDRTLQGVFDLERHWLRFGNLPLGSSLLLVARRRGPEPVAQPELLRAAALAAA